MSRLPNVVRPSFPLTNHILTALAQQPTVVLLREGTDSSQGTPQLLSNISACLAVAQTIATTLGPRGMDKLIVNERGEATISSESSLVLNGRDDGWLMVTCVCR